MAANPLHVTSKIHNFAWKDESHSCYARSPSLCSTEEALKCKGEHITQQSLLSKDHHNTVHSAVSVLAVNRLCKPSKIPLSDLFWQLLWSTDARDLPPANLILSFLELQCLMKLWHQYSSQFPTSINTSSSAQFSHFKHMCCMRINWIMCKRKGDGEIFLLISEMSLSIPFISPVTKKIPCFNLN